VKRARTPTTAATVVKEEVSVKEEVGVKEEVDSKDTLDLKLESESELSNIGSVVSNVKGGSKRQIKKLQRFLD